jgi:hypothetical protein
MGVSSVAPANRASSGGLFFRDAPRNALIAAKIFLDFLFS